MTYGDWIRSMSDEELALFIYGNIGNFMAIMCSEKYVVKIYREFFQSERSENDTLPGMDNMTEEQWRMFADTVE